MEGDKLEDKESSVNTKHGYEQHGRGDEEEYSRVPIAGENDSDYDIFEDLYDGTTAKKVTRVRKELSTRRRPTTWPMPLHPTFPGKWQ